MNDLSKPPFRWFIFRADSRILGSFSRTEDEALADVQERLRPRNRLTSKSAKRETPELTRDTEAEARANAALSNHAKAQPPALAFG